MTEEQQKAKLEEESTKLVERLKNAKIPGIMPCEYSHCQCKVKAIIGARTMSVVVFPDLHAEAVCQNAVLDYAARTKAKI